MLYRLRCTHFRKHMCNSLQHCYIRNLYDSYQFPIHIRRRLKLKKEKILIKKIIFSQIKCEQYPWFFKRVIKLVRYLHKHSYLRTFLSKNQRSFLCNHQNKYMCINQLVCYHMNHQFHKEILLSTHRFLKNIQGTWELIPKTKGFVLFCLFWVMVLLDGRRRRK